MRIGFVYDGMYPYAIGGIETRIWELSKRLSHRGHEVHLFGTKYWEGTDVMVKDGVHLHGVCKPQELFINGRRSIKQALYFGCKVLTPLLGQALDVIDCQNFPYFSCFSVKLAAMRRKPRLVITWHEVWGDYWFQYLGKKGIFGKFVEQIVAKLTDSIVAVSKLTKDDLEGMGVKSRVTLIPNGVDCGRIRDLPPLSEKTDILFAGRLIKEKNVDILIRSIRHLKGELPDIRCTIVGDGPERSNLERLVHELGLETNILLTGRIKEYEQVLSYMKSSRVFVSPSSREGFGIAALEANACGLPVVTVDHPQNATRYLIREGDNGYVCQLSEEAIVRKIVVALSTNEEMQEKCRQFSYKYDWDKIADVLENYYMGKPCPEMGFEWQT